MLTLSLTDHADNTGFVASVAGSLGATVSVWYTPADRPWPGDAWALAGTRTGDGDLAVAVPNRFYFCYASIVGEATPPERVAATSGLASVAQRVQDAVAALVKLCALDRIGDNVLTQVLLDVSEYRYPCAAVYLEGLSESEEKSTNGSDDIVYPAAVFLFDSGVKRSRHDHRSWVQKCRQQVFRALRNRHLAGVPESVIVRVRPGVIAQERYDGANGLPWQYYAGGFTVSVVCREPRGLGS